MDIILASASRRRQELLKLIFDEFSVINADIEEICPADLKAVECPEYLAIKKAGHISKTHPDSLVIGADTAVFLDGKMLGKPENEEDALEMLSSLSGREHLVITGCALAYKGDICSFSVSSKVEFLDLSKEEIKEYIKTKEPADKAGGYGIQGRGSLLVKKIEGDYFNIVGLPVSALNRKIKEFLD